MGTAFGPSLAMDTSHRCVFSQGETMTDEKKTINFAEAVRMAAEVIAPRWDYVYVGSETGCINWTCDIVDEGLSWKRVGSCVIGCIIEKNSDLNLIGMGDSSGTSMRDAGFRMTPKAARFMQALQTRQDRRMESWGLCFISALKQVEAGKYSDEIEYAV